MRTLAAIVVVVGMAVPAWAAEDVSPATPAAVGQPLALTPAPTTTGAPPLPHLAPSGSGAAANDLLLAHLAGDWIGRGLIRQSAAAQPERVYCKITNVLSADGNALKQQGRCALATQSGAVHGLITARGDGRYDGSLQTLGSDGPATLTGTGAGDRIVLVAQFVDRLTHQPATSTTTIEVLPGGGYQLTAERTDPKTGLPFTASKIIFGPH